MNARQTQVLILPVQATDVCSNRIINAKSRKMWFVDIDVPRFIRLTGSDQSLTN